MATRTIQASISSNSNTDLEPGMSARFSVTSDTGPVSGMTATGGSLYLSRVKIYSSAFYLTVAPSSGGTAKTEALSANSGDTASTTLDLDSVNDSLLSGSPTSINLTVTKISGDKTKMNFRDGCTLTLKIDYQEGGSSGGDSGGSSGGVISGPYLDKVTGVKLSAEESSGEAVTLSWNAVPDKAQNTVTHYQIGRALLDENGYLDYGILVENTGNVTSYEVYPPDEIGNRWYSYYVRACGSASEVFNGVWSDECGYLERIPAQHLDKVTGVRLSAEESSGEAVTLSWNPVASTTYNTVTHYQIGRALSTEDEYLEINDDWVLDAGNVTSYEVYPPDEIGDRWYSYRVRACGSAGAAFNGEWSDECGWLERIPSTTDIDPYTDPTLKANETPVKAVHMTELQSNINKIRATHRLGTYRFTSITSGTTGLAGWTDHVTELRAAIDEIGKTHETWISITVNQPRADVIMQLREVVADIAAG